MTKANRGLLLAAAAGIATTAAATLFMIGAIDAHRLLYPVIVIAVLGAAAGVACARFRPLPLRRSLLPSAAAFAAGMVVASLVVALYVHLTSLGIADPRHRVVWPQFAVLFIATVLLGVTAFTTATLVASRIAGYRETQTGRPSRAA